MNNLLEIKHVHHLLELLMYTTDSIEHVTNLQSFVRYYSEPKSDKECLEICLVLLKYVMIIGCIKIHFPDWSGEYSNRKNNIDIGLLEIQNNWANLQEIELINGKKLLIEYWIEWTDEWREELLKLKLLEN
ncbi:hypothetical protein GCM10023115_24790 [Pontixanthobacter gangjinensis]|uniref:Uncharacterized protein n=1 Tax=Christiangramia aestuarii TaxID=1028746 RepID=A0A7K1LSY1_9FLAO|nr:hypothetical protein [Christiangramia aestuarii]MUP43888.1 hypothetical protein [Christiangramia aestuarii]